MSMPNHYRYVTCDETCLGSNNQRKQAEINENAPAPAAIHSNQAPNIQHPTPLTDQSTLRLHRALQLSSVSVTTMECLALLKYPIQYQVRVESDNVGKILKPLLTCITIYINIQFETIENFMKDLAKLLNDNNLPSTIVEQFFQLGNVDVALLAYHIKSEAFITKELEKDVKQEINILSDAIHYYWASLLRGASLDSDLLWPDDYTATEQHKLRSFVKAKLQMISEPLDTSQSRINATLAIRYVQIP